MFLEHPPLGNRCAQVLQVGGPGNDAGLLDGLAATTHFGAEAELREAAPNTTIRMSERYVDNGKVITSAGISAGIDMALYTVSRLLGAEAAADTAHHMQYDYWKDQ